MNNILKDVYAQVRARDLGIMDSIQRLEYLPYNMDLALKFIEKVGKKRRSSFVIDKQNKFVFTNLIRWVHGDPEFKSLDPITKEMIKGDLSKGFYLAGATGTGKSWALDIISIYTLVDNVQIKIDDIPKALVWKNYRTDAICDSYSRTGDLEKFKRTNIIGLQDLGTEQKESLYMGNRIDVIRQILESRGDFTDKITLITSNLPIGHPSITERYGERVASRLGEMCNYFELKGADRRKSNNKILMK